MWSEERRQFESGVALRLPPHSKTLPYAGGSWKASISFLRMHWDDELISLGRARLRRALIFVAPKEFQGLDGVSPYLEVHGERQPARSAFKTELWNFHGFFESDLLHNFSQLVEEKGLLKSEVNKFLLARFLDDGLCVS